MAKLLRSPISIIVGLSFIISLTVYLWALLSFNAPILQIIRLTQAYALIALSCIYLALLTLPISHIAHFSNAIPIRKGLGVSAFYFGLLHASLAFFGQLGGFEGLFFLSSSYLLNVSLGFITLLLLLLFTLMSFSFIQKRVGKSFSKGMNLFLYSAGVFILVHALLLGTHFQDLLALIPQIALVALLILLGLEALRLDKFLQDRLSFIPRFGIAFTLLLGALISYLYMVLLPADSPLTLGIHAQHIAIAKQAQQGTINSNLPNIPGLDGDRTRRFTVTFDHPERVSPNEEVTLTFKVYDASSGNRVTLFNQVYEKLLHMIVVNDGLDYFDHIHPEFEEDEFVITTSFPDEGNYHIYLDFQPFGAIEQQFAFTIAVGNATKKAIANAPVDTNLTKTFGDYEVTLQYPQPLIASQLTIGQQELTFTIQDAKTGERIQTLKPYLSSFGHMVMINKDTYDYLHVHPGDLTPPKPNENGGPDVKFLPIGLHGPIKPGIYKVFAQFNPDNNLFTSDFTITVE